MKTSDVVWEEPPTRYRSAPRARLWPERLEPLMTRRGTWARVWVYNTPQGGSRTVWGLNHGQTGLPPGRWEFTSRSLPEGKSAVYARYLGPDEVAS
jgi:hypothetical protein